MSDSPPKNCPFCDGEIKSAAIKCRYCKRFLNKQKNDFFWFKLFSLPLALLIAMGLFEYYFSNHANVKKPYSVLLNRFRQIDEARNYVSRVKQKAFVDPYIVTRRVGGNGIWNEVHAGALSDQDQAKNYQDKLSQDGVSAVGVRNFKDYKKSLVNESVLRKDEAAENYKEPSQVKPDIGNEALQLIQMFPESNDYNIEETYLISMPPQIKTSEKALCFFSINHELPDSRLPLGIRKFDIYKESDRFGLALYRDSLDGAGGWVVAGFLRDSTAPSKVLTDFETEVKSEVKNEGNAISVTLGGVPFKGKYFLREKNRNQEILLFIKEEGILGRFFMMSVKNRDWNYVKVFLNGIHFNDGLLKYPEVKNHIYTLPKLGVPGETFYFYDLKRLTEYYAKLKNNAEWAERMVGHWNSSGFYLCSSGTLDFGYFDLAYYSQAHRIYDELYLKGETRTWNSQELSVNGLPGRWVQLPGENLNEVSYRIGKDVVAVDGNFDKDFLIEHAKRLQL